MEPLRAEQIVGNWASVLLPIQPDESIDFARLADEVERLVAFRVNGIYTNGSAGEFYAQSEEEFDRISSMVADRCQGAGMPFQIGAAHPCAQTALSRIRRARLLRPGTIQVILSDWMPLSDEEVIACLQRFAEAADPVGLVLYNPPHAKRVLPPPLYGVLRRAVPSLVGLKVLGGDEAWYAAMREHAAGLSLFTAGHYLASGLRLGSSGAYSNIACLHPGGAQRWYEQMRTDPAGALDLEKRIERFLIEQLQPVRERYGLSGPATDKLWAAIGAWADVGTRVRWPYRSVPQAEADRLRPIACALLPELLG
jgi:dihydrodipicolinate synthase/N-acetylneuraminate lyase